MKVKMKRDIAGYIVLSSQMIISCLGYKFIIFQFIFAFILVCLYYKDIRGFVCKLYTKKKNKSIYIIQED